jgi:hypothetical protein
MVSISARKEAQDWTSQSRHAKVVWELTHMCVQDENLP